MKRSLVDYSSDSSGAEDENEYGEPSVKSFSQHRSEVHQTSAENERLPSVPAAVKCMYRETEIKESAERQNYDNSENHKGRKRTFQHERGNWATYVYVPFEVDCDYEDFARTALQQVSDITDFHLIETPHISVTKTFPIRFHIIAPLMNSIREALSNIRVFTCLLDDLDVYVNEEKTRTFIGLKVSYGHNDLVKIISSLDDVLKEYHLPVFYQEPSLHLSFAWCLGDFSRYFTCERLQQLKALLVSEDGAKYEFTSIYVSHLEYKSGNKQVSFMLNT
ncbi:U6 snRNA phosphodiesterase 1-like [Tubulanus polymorphus]|uniref:U6 snRNA phosphodiesterase 1-like n=1 Tax=Tubulanus polymorphus TaxID=672921 RepID=UPI003DA62351